MNSNHRIQTKQFTALCPKCDAVAFKRSSTRNKLEKMMRETTDKVPYRCHECGYRKLVDPGLLRYPVYRPDTDAEQEENYGEIELPSAKIDAVPTGTERNMPDTGVPEERIPASPSDIPERQETPPEPARMPDMQKDVNTAGLQMEGSLNELFDERDEAEADEAEYTTSSRRLKSSGKHPTATCPVCGGLTLHRSHSRSIFEEGRKRITTKRPYRCHACGWRGWLRKA